MLKNTRKRFETNIDSIKESNQIFTICKYGPVSIETINRIISQVFNEVALSEIEIEQFDISISFKKIKSKIQHSNLSNRIKHSINDILEKKSVYVRKFRLMEFKHIFEKQKYELEEIEQTFREKRSILMKNYKVLSKKFYSMRSNNVDTNNNIIRYLRNSSSMVMLHNIVDNGVSFTKNKLPSGDHYIIVYKTRKSARVNIIEKYKNISLCKTMKDFIHAYEIATIGIVACNENVMKALDIFSYL
jgi:hypothetical protein